MENLRVNSRTTMMGLRFLLTPEESSASPFAATVWSWVKTLLWVVVSVLAALLVGQL